MTCYRMWRVAMVAAALLFAGAFAGGCGGDDSGDSPAGAGGTGAGTTTTGGSGDPSVDWDALRFQHDAEALYTAYEPDHLYQVPVWVPNLVIPLDGWSVEPAEAAMLDEDPENGGVLVTIQQAVDKVTVSARQGNIGGRIDIIITAATADQWTLGEMRYRNGAEFMPPTMDDFSRSDSGEILYQGMPVDPSMFAIPEDLSCNNCHTTGAMILEVQHTPTQAARFSDAELIGIFTEGMKPAGVEYRVLPAFIAPTLYAAYHTWEATEEEKTGLVVYLRSLTPEPQQAVEFPFSMLPGGGGGFPGGGN